MEHIKTIISILVGLTIVELLQSFDKSGPIALLIVMIFVIILLINGIISIIKRIMYLPNSKTIKGTIVDVKANYRVGKTTNYFPIVEYKDIYTSKKCIYESNTPRISLNYKVGDKVDLRYYIYKGKMEVFIDSRYDIWMVPITQIICAVGALTIMSINYLSLK